MGDLSHIGKPQFTNNEEESVITWVVANGDRVTALIDTKDHRIAWIGKFGGEYVRGGDEPWPAGMTEMLKRIGVGAKK